MPDRIGLAAVRSRTSFVWLRAIKSSGFLGIQVSGLQGCDLHFIKIPFLQRAPRLPHLERIINGPHKSVLGIPVFELPPIASK